MKLAPVFVKKPVSAAHGLRLVFENTGPPGNPDQNRAFAWAALPPISIPMFGEFLKRLMADTPDPLDQPDARLALTALLVRLAKTDGDYAIQEVALIEEIAGNRFGLNIEEIADLREDAEKLESEAPDTVRFTKAIKSAVPYEDRIGVIEAMWSVVMADGVRDDHESALMRMVAPMLGVSDRDSAVARQKVESTRG